MEEHGHDWTRRDILRAGALASAGLLGMGLPAACASPSAMTGPSSHAGRTQSSSTGTEGTKTGASAAAPKRGGTLRAAVTGGSPHDVLIPASTTTPPAYAGVRMIFDTLISQGPTGTNELQLAQEITPDSKATSWTIRLRDGVEFHDGKPLTADDLIYTFQFVMDPKNNATYAPLLAPVDVNGIKKLDKMTVEVPCKTPYSILADVIAYSSWFSVLPTTYDPKRPNGTGPFKFESFNPGQQLVTTRNPNYWMTGQPYVDRVVLTNYADETSEINALLAGQVDIIALLSSAGAKTVQSGGGVPIVSKTGGWTPIVMRVDVDPFKDVRVRQAFKLMVNRQQLLDVIFDGQGTIGNDIFSPFDPAYDKSIAQRPHDPDQAKSLLKAAGFEGLTIDFTTSTVYEGTVQLATVFAQQASAAGVKVNVKNISTADFYGPNWLNYPLTTDYWSYTPYLVQVPQCTMPGMFDETHFNDDHYNRLYAEALTKVDAAEREPIIHEMQKIDWDEGGYIIPYFYPLIDAHAKNVAGMNTSVNGSDFCDWQDFKTIYFTD